MKSEMTPLCTFEADVDSRAFSCAEQLGISVDQFVTDAFRAAIGFGPDEIEDDEKRAARMNALEGILAAKGESMKDFVGRAIADAIERHVGSGKTQPAMVNTLLLAQADAAAKHSGMTRSELLELAVAKAFTLGAKEALATAHAELVVAYALRHHGVPDLLAIEVPKDVGGLVESSAAKLGVQTGQFLMRAMAAHAPSASIDCDLGQVVGEAVRKAAAQLGANGSATGG